MSVLRSGTALLLPALALLALACSTQAAPATSSSAEPTPAPAPAAEPSATVEVGPSPTPVEEAPSSASTPEPPTQVALSAPSGSPPKVDKSIANVPLDEVVFDTFRGGFIPLSQASDEVIETLRDAIKPIYVPKYDSVEGGDWLSDDDLVIGYWSETGAFAYPIKMLNLHEIVNDVIDGVPVLVSYCPLCASAVVYGRELDGQTLVFGNTSALFESDMVMYDHETGSYWFQVLGEAIVGPLTGKRLALLPSVTTTWGRWKEQHPETKVLSLDIGLLGSGGGNPYARDPFAGYGDRVDRGQFVFPVSEYRLDGRLTPGATVFAVEVVETHKGYPLSDRPDRVMNDEVGGESVVVIARADGPTAAAYIANVDGRSLTFRLTDDGAVEDAQTQSRWSDAGLAVSGPMAGTALIPVPSRTSFWFSLVGAIPGIELHAP